MYKSYVIREYSVWYENVFFQASNLIVPSHVTRSHTDGALLIGYLGLRLTSCVIQSFVNWCSADWYESMMSIYLLVLFWNKLLIFLNLFRTSVGIRANKTVNHLKSSQPLSLIVSLHELIALRLIDAKWVSLLASSCQCCDRVLWLSS